METGTGPPPERGSPKSNDDMIRASPRPDAAAPASDAARVAPAQLPGWARPVAAVEVREATLAGDSDDRLRAVTESPETSPDPASGPTRPGTPVSHERGAVPPGRTLSSHVVKVVIVPFVIVIATAVIAVGLAGAARSAQSASVRHVEAAEQELAVASEIDRLWSNVLGVVAGGVGQRTVTAEELVAQLGAVRAAVDPGAGEVPVPAAGDAARERSRFIESVSSAVERSDGDPVEIGNELDALAASYRDAAGESQRVREQHRSLAADASSRSDRLWWTALGVLGVGLLATALAAVGARRRLRREVDQGVGALRDSALALSGADHAGSDAPATLADVGAALELAVSAVERDRLALERRAEWGEHARMIAEALDLAEEEHDACEVVSQSFALIDPTLPAELLLNERSGIELHEVAVSPAAGTSGCPVETTTACVAIRRGQVSIFESSEAINACPKLRDRPEGEISAVCVPVAVKGRAVGVLHVTAAVDEPPTPQVVDRLKTLSALIGTRFTALRTLELSRREASTDQLTGLPNRRTLEAEIAALLSARTPFVMVLADLDKFKRLNDNFGHEVGDRALQLFSGVLRDNVRGNDVVARLGGEEFVLVYPNMSVAISIEAIGRLRSALASAIAASSVPPFTCSFGVTHSSVGGDGDAILRVADAGLLRAKSLGGDQAVFADRELAASIFASADGTDDGRDPGGAEPAGLDGPATPDDPATPGGETESGR